MRRRIAALGCLLALAAGGCAPRPEEPEGGYCVYYSALSDLYRMGIGSGNYSYATAVGLFEGLINLVLLTLANIVSKKTTESGLF